MKNSRSRSVLFLSLSGIGNLVMQLPTIKVLKESHPDWHIAVWVAPRGTKELALAQPYIDEVLEMPITASMFQHIQNIFTLRNKHFDIGIVLTPGQLLKSAVYLFLAGIPRRIGHMYPFRGNIESSFLLTDAIPEELDTHDVEQNIKLLEILGVYAEKNQPYHIQIPEKNKEEALASLPLTKGEMEGVKFIGIHAGSAQGFEFKHWPIERYAEVARYVLQKDPTITFLLFGGPAEDDQKKKLKALIDSSNVIEVSASLMTTAALMQYCKCILSGDSGLMHVAAASGIPTISLFGPTDEKLTGPRGKHDIVVRAEGAKPVYNTEYATHLGSTPHASMLAIETKKVLDTIYNSVL